MAVGSSTYGYGSGVHEHSFIYVNGEMQPLGSYTGDNSADAINNLGGTRHLWHAAGRLGPGGLGAP